MSISTIPVIMERIDVASETSPIAVFRLPVGRELHQRQCFEAVFYSTVTTRQRAEVDKAFAGAFHNKMNRDMVYQTLRSQLK